MSEPIADEVRVARALRELGEHFDTVQIFATRHESGEENGTVHVSLGLGNWYARFGQVQMWLNAEGFPEPEPEPGEEDAG